MHLAFLVVEAIVVFLAGAEISRRLYRKYSATTGQRISVPLGHSFERGDKIKIDGKRFMVLDAYSDILYVKRRFL